MLSRRKTTALVAVILATVLLAATAALAAPRSSMKATIRADRTCQVTATFSWKNQAMPGYTFNAAEVVIQQVGYGNVITPALLVDPDPTGTITTTATLTPGVSYLAQGTLAFQGIENSDLYLWPEAESRPLTLRCATG